MIDSVAVLSSEITDTQFLFFGITLVKEWLHTSTVNISEVSAEHYFDPLKNMTSAKIA